MSNLILYKNNGRVALNTLDDNNLKKKLNGLLCYCSQILGMGAKPENVAFTAGELSEILKRDYKRYDFSEIEQILKSGFANFGTAFKTISVASCMDIIRRFDEDAINRDKLFNAIKNSEDQKNGSMTEAEKAFEDKKRKEIAYKIAVEKYKNGTVKEADIYHSFSNCYHHVKENLSDNTIDFDEEKRREIWNKVKLFYQKTENENALQSDKKSVLNSLLKLIPKEMMLKSMFRSALFNLWAEKNLEIKNG